ncbi:MAG: superoxide dismutase family protein [Chromatiaceae bacterium]|nr:superoxide dismutase family protein [Chromatiaceae bacterium]
MRLIGTAMRALVIHQGADNSWSQPSGTAGPRIACGVIEAQTAYAAGLCRQTPMRPARGRPRRDRRTGSGTWQGLLVRPLQRAGRSSPSVAGGSRGRGLESRARPDPYGRNRHR